MLAGQQYKQDSDEKRNEKVRSEQSLKLKVKYENLDRKKTDLQTTINILQDSIEKETLKADKNQDLSAVSKAAALLRFAKEKEKNITRPQRCSD